MTMYKDFCFILVPIMFCVRSESKDDFSCALSRHLLLVVRCKCFMYIFLIRLGIEELLDLYFICSLNSL